MLFEQGYLKMGENKKRRGTYRTRLPPFVGTVGTSKPSKVERGSFISESPYQKI
jgi:hypothetical protein